MWALLLIAGLITMADDRRALLEKYYGPSDYMGNIEAGEPLPASTTGDWDEPPPQAPPGPSWGDYLKGLPTRAMLGWGDTGRLMRDDPAAYRRTTPIVGDALLAKDAIRDKDWLGAGLHGLSAVGDLAGAGGKAAKAGVLLKDLPYLKWAEDMAAHPALLDKQKSAWVEFLQKQAGVKSPKAGSKATLARDAKAEALARARHPEPSAPGGTEEATRRLGAIDRTWPGNALAGSAAVGAATGIPGVMLGDAMTHLNPMHQMWEEDKQEQQAPFQAGSEPETAHYQQQIDRVRHERNVHAGLAAGSLPAGVGTAYGTIKSAPWAMRHALPGLELALMGGMVHPALAVPGLAMAAAPLALPLALGASTWGLANVAPGQIEQAQKKHAYAELIQHIQDQYREPGPSLTPDQSY